jgi:16S rRNA (guanine527-N7)-methyltransferase
VKRAGPRSTDDLSPEQVALLRRFERFLRDRAIPAGAVARGDSDVLWERHVLDSLRGLDCLSNGPPSELADVGSGAGLPGVPLAIALPATTVYLIEPRRLRASLLEATVAELGLSNAHVVHATAAASRLAVDVAVARALAPPVDAWRIANPVLRPTGTLLLWAGASWQPPAPSEIQVAICAPPLTEGQGPVVMMSGRSGPGGRGNL